MEDLCPCGLEKVIKEEMSIQTRESVDVLSCLCGRERAVVLYGPYDKVTSAHEKFMLLAGDL